MLTSTIAVIIKASFEETIKNDTDGNGKIDFTEADNFIEHTEKALAEIKEMRRNHGS